MQALLFVLIVAAMIASVATGVVYVSNEPDRASINVDKQRLEEVQKDTTEAVQKAVQKVEEQATEIRENISGERSQPVEAKPADAKPVDAELDRDPIVFPQ